MVFIYIVPVFLTICYLVYNHFTKYNNYWKERNVPGPEPSFFFGNVKDSALRRKHIGEVFADIYHRYQEEKVVGIYTMRQPALLIRDLDIVKHIMIKDFEVFADRGISFSDKGLALNLFHADVDTWRILRTRFTPLFTSGKLRNMMHLLTDCADKFLAYLETTTRLQTEQDLHSLIQKYTQASIAACAFGIDLDTYNESSKQLERIDKLLFTLNYAPELDGIYPGIMKKIGVNLFPKEATEFFQNITRTIINERNGKPTNRNDFMDFLLELRDKQLQNRKATSDDKQMILEMNDDIIAAQAFVFYAGGYETCAATLANMLYMLALNPDIQDKLVAEIDDTIKVNHGILNLETLLGMRYLGQVFDETLRMYPAANTLSRKSQANYRVPGTDVVLEQGTSVYISLQGIVYDEKIFPNPNVFDPERFTPENIANRHSCAHLVFGEGPRNCIGIRFAQLQSRMCITKLLSKFRVEPSKNTPKSFRIDPNRTVCTCVDKLRVNLVSRS